MSLNLFNIRLEYRAKIGLLLLCINAVFVRWLVRSSVSRNKSSNSICNIWNDFLYALFALCQLIGYAKKFTAYPLSDLNLLSRTQIFEENKKKKKNCERQELCHKIISFHQDQINGLNLNKKKFDIFFSSRLLLIKSQAFEFIFGCCCCKTLFAKKKHRIVCLWSFRSQQRSFGILSLTFSLLRDSCMLNLVCALEPNTKCLLKLCS